VSGDLPAGPMIVLVGAGLFVFSLLVAPQRGIVSRLWSESRLRLRIAREHLLRALYELNEPLLPRVAPVQFSRLAAYRHWRPWMLRWLVDQGERRGLLDRTNGDVKLTPLGLRRGAEVTKTHRMWEIYMMEFAGSAADHVDRSADAVEHMLPEGLLVKLEERLARAGRLPQVTPEAPASPHEIGGE
jgi:manganese/zinc/iron transport system permease protein